MLGNTGNTPLFWWKIWFLPTPTSPAALGGKTWINMEHQNTFGIPSTVLSTLLDFNIFQPNTVTSICNSLGSRLPQNLKYSYPTCLAQGFKFAGLHQPGSGPRIGHVSDNWVHPLRREDKAPEPPLAPWHAKNFRNKHLLRHSKLNLGWRLNVQNWPSGSMAILRWSNQPLKIEPVRKPVHVDSEKI